MITCEQRANILVIASNNPPVNALGAAIRTGLATAFAQAATDDNVEAIVIYCHGRTFFAGADISEFGKTLTPPLLPEIFCEIEASAKPVIAAIHGTALGGGLELALSTHYRVAVPSAKLGLPEVKLGLLPGAGGTQRLPRIVGVKRALEMAVFGTAVSAKEALEAGLIDRMVGESTMVEDAIAFAQEVAHARPLPRSGARRVSAEPSLFSNFRIDNARKFKGFEAPEAIIQAIEASVVHPFAEGAAIERALFHKLLNGAQSAAQRYMFFAERQASKITELPDDSEPLDIRRVGIIGAGTMGSAIAMNFLSINIPVTIVDTTVEALNRGVTAIRETYESGAVKGRFSAEQVKNAIALLAPSLEFSALGDCDLVIEAVFELMEVKKQIFKRLDAVAQPGAILASNTSYLNIDEMAAATHRPDQVVGLHFFSPANVMKLLEVVRGKATAPRVLATAIDLAKKIKKTAVVAGNCHGFIGNRMLRVRQVAAMNMLFEGATPSQIDKVITDFGLPMGPFQMADLAGVDIGWHRDEGRRETLQDILCSEGRLGQKASKGYYDYEGTRRAVRSTKVEQLIREFAASKGFSVRQIGDQEILERCLYPMVNEGAKITEEHIAQRASDLDVVWVNGYGWPIWRGGPMFWADTIGLDKIVAGLRAHEKRLGSDFKFSPLLLAKAEAKGRFLDNR